MTTNKVLIACRMGSSRLPGKTLMEINGEKMLEFIVNRITRVIPRENICAATTTNKEDDEIEKYCEQIRINCYRGSTDNLVERLIKAAEYMTCNSFIEVLGDNPFIDTRLLKAVIDLYEKNEIDYAACATNEYPVQYYQGGRFPIGTRIQVVKVSALKMILASTRSRYHLEHSSTYMIENPQKFRIKLVYAEGKFLELNEPELNLAVNKELDLQMVDRLARFCHQEYGSYELGEVIKSLKSNYNSVKNNLQ